MSEHLKFSRDLEQTIETEGDNIGRVKDIDVAQDIANTANNSPVEKDRLSPEFESRQSVESRDVIIEKELRLVLAKKAITNQLMYSVDPMARQLLRDGKMKDKERWEAVAVAQFTDNAPSRVREVLDQYDSITQTARRQKRRKD